MNSHPFVRREEFILINILRSNKKLCAFPTQHKKCATIHESQTPFVDEFEREMGPAQRNCCPTSLKLAISPSGCVSAERRM